MCSISRLKRKNDECNKKREEGRVLEWLLCIM